MIHPIRVAQIRFLFLQRFKIITMEIWKDIEGFEGEYQVSNFGNVKSLQRIVNDNGGKKEIPEMILTPDKTKQGYLRATLYKNQKRRKYSIHRLVAKAFIQNPDNKKCVNHIDLVKDNNRLENLEWVTHSENSRHSLSNRPKRIYKKSGKINELNVKSRPVMQISKEGILINTYPSLQEVNRLFGFHHANVGACARGKLKTAYGYKWAYPS